MNSSEREFYFQWHFLNKCNLRCKHCYQEGYEAIEFPLEKLKEVANQIIIALNKWDMYGRISITGGEPFTSKQLYPLLEYLDGKERIKSINILTNGTLITEDDIKKLKSIKKLYEIQISLDGDCEEVHDTVRGAGAFNKALNGIRKLKENGFRVAIMYTVMPNNKDGVIGAIDLAEKENVDAMTVERVTPCGHGSNMTDLQSEDIKEIFYSVTERAKKIKNNLKIRRSRPLWVNTLHLESDEEKKENIGGFCPVGLTAMAILWDGTVLPCRRLEIPIGNILEDGIFKIWYGSELLWNIRDKNKLKGKCKGCNDMARCGGCRAVAYAMTGDYMESDTQCWK